MARKAVISHRDLSDLALKWLKRPLSKNGHGCQIAFAEPRISYLDGETPDAIGFRVSTRRYGGGSTVVECKTSRSDFLRDREKPHRADGRGMGRFRYFLCPEGLIDVDEVPSGWGLLYLAARRTIRVVSGATLSIREPGPFDLPHDAFTETLLLANLLHRVGDAERLNARLRSADRANQSLIRRIERQEATLRHLRSEYFKLSMGVDSAA